MLVAHMGHVMLNPITTKISMYLKLGLLVIIIACLVFIGIQYVRIEALKKNVDNLEIKNAIFNKDNLFSDETIKIDSDFTNSDIAIDEITNIIIFDEPKQATIDKIISDFYKE